MMFKCLICGEEFYLDVLISELQNHFSVKHHLELTTLEDLNTLIRKE
jgi:hypothetical protein